MNRRGFTLIELAMVLVIIGFIVGGVLVGRDLIAAATIRAQISQLQKYQTAVNAFKLKYNALPGDIAAAQVAALGFTAAAGRPGTSGFGDGNGFLDGTNCCSSYSYLLGSEILWFWEDLSTNSSLIEGNYNTAGTTGATNAANCTSIAGCSVYFPYSVIGNSSFVYVYNNCCGSGTSKGANFFGLSIINSVQNGNVIQGATPPAPALTTAQSFSIDTKIDDGMPTTGNILAQYLWGTGLPTWSTNGASATTTTCYDTSSGTAAYTLNKGSKVNCGLSFAIK